jgi:hypothetical protein
MREVREGGEDGEESRGRAVKGKWVTTTAWVYTGWEWGPAQKEGDDSENQKKEVQWGWKWDWYCKRGDWELEAGWVWTGWGDEVE